MSRLMNSRVIDNSFRKGMASKVTGRRVLQSVDSPRDDVTISHVLAISSVYDYCDST